MDSLPAAGTVRRTVRVAVALVVGQALLVALIGWLTLTRSDGSGGTVDQMAALPATPLPTTVGRYADPPAPPAASTSVATPPATRRTTAGRKSEPATVAPQAPSRTAKPVPATLPPEPTPTIVVTPTVVPPALAPPQPSPPASPPPTSPSIAPGPVVVGYPCAPEGAYAYTAHGVLVRCTRLWHHRLRWKIV